MFSTLRHAAETTRQRNLPGAEKNCCEAGSKHLCAVLPNFARACGRVSVGRYPDKRPDSRQGMKKPRVALSRLQNLSGQHLSPEMPLKATSPPCNRDWQPEANRRTSFSTGDAT